MLITSTIIDVDNADVVDNYTTTTITITTTTSTTFGGTATVAMYIV
jgi:hypothetical protein